MTELTRPLRRLLGRREGALESRVSLAVAPAAGAILTPAENRSIAVEIAESDPLLAYLQTAPGPVEVARLELDSRQSPRCAKLAWCSWCRWSPRAS